MEYLDKVEKFESDLKAAGIEARTWSAEDALFLERMRDGKFIRIDFPEREVDFSYHIDESFRQCVLTVKEEKRSFKERVSVEVNYLCPEDLEELTPGKFIKKYDLRDRLERNRTNVENSTYRVLKVEDEDYYNEYKEFVNITIRVSAPEQTNCFLFGLDEKHYFICQLPEVVSTVKQAHKILRPKGLPKDTPRVGEFYLPTVGKKMNEKLSRLRDYSDSGADLDQNITFGDSLDELGENHVASCIIEDGDTKYLTGLLEDIRKFHKDVYFSDWRKIIRNNEIPGESDSWD